MKREIFIFILVMVSLSLFSIVSAESSDTFQQGVAITIDVPLIDENFFPLKSCDSANMTINYQNGSLLVENGAATCANGHGYYSLTTAQTSVLGTYKYSFNFCSSGKCGQMGASYEVTESGETFGLPQAIMLLGLFTFIALFFAIGLTFNKEKWKLKTFFNMVALIMGVIFLNSIRIIIGTSSGLAKMGQAGLIVGIVVLSFMFMYFLVLMTIEVFGYFKQKREMKWSISGP